MEYKYLKSHKTCTIEYNEKSKKYRIYNGFNIFGALTRDEEIITNDFCPPDLSILYLTGDKISSWTVTQLSDALCFNATVCKATYRANIYEYDISACLEESVNDYTGEYSPVLIRMNNLKYLEKHNLPLFINLTHEIVRAGIDKKDLLRKKHRELYDYCFSKLTSEEQLYLIGKYY